MEDVKNSEYKCASQPCWGEKIVVQPQGDRVALIFYKGAWRAGSVHLKLEKLRELADELTDLADEIEGEIEGEETPARKFKVGDKVRCVPGADPCFSGIGEVDEDDGDDEDDGCPYYVKFSGLGRASHYNADELELAVEPEPQPETTLCGKKIGDKVVAKQGTAAAWRGTKVLTITAISRCRTRIVLDGDGPGWSCLAADYILAPLSLQARVAALEARLAA